MCDRTLLIFVAKTMLKISAVNKWTLLYLRFYFLLYRLRIISVNVFLVETVRQTIHKKRREKLWWVDVVVLWWFESGKRFTFMLFKLLYHYCNNTECVHKSKNTEWRIHIIHTCMLLCAMEDFNAVCVWLFCTY